MVLRIASPFLRRYFDQNRSLSTASAEAARVAIAAFVVPQLSSLLWWIHTSSAIHFRGWINAEYLLLLALALLFPSWGMLVVLTVELTISLIEPIAHLYYFSPADLVFSFRYLLWIPPARLAGYTCLLIAYIIGCAAALRVCLGRRRRPLAKPMAGLLLLCVLVPTTVDLASGRFRKSQVAPQPGDLDVRDLHAVQMPVISLLHGILLGIGHSDSGSSEPLPSALNEALGELGSGSQPDVVLVLTESWGLAKDERLNQAQIQPYRDPAIDHLYRVQTGTVPFSGLTTSGETRELCGDSRGRYGRSSPNDFVACWPARLEKAGYHTLAVHGFAPGMYTRKDWYQQFGFQQSAFLPELMRDNAALCGGAFPGACDADVAQWVGTRLSAARDQHPMFVHWVTLNSHLPLAPLDNKSDSGDCVTFGIDQERSLCSWFIHVRLVQDSVARLALMPGLRPTVFVIVGDHAPPFMETAMRDRFSQTKVPYVLLMPRSVPSTVQAKMTVPPPQEARPLP
jgi:Sulfatase